MNLKHSFILCVRVYMRTIPFVLFLLFSLTALTGRLFAQDTLPNITVKNLGGKIIISWKNNYTSKISTMNIQRSFDSTKNFSTIGSILNPSSTENGFADTKPPYTKMYYRVFIAFEGGDYTFSQSHRPVKDTTRIIVNNNNDSISRDSINIVIPEVKPAPPSGFVPSKNIYVGKGNNVIINLPHADTKKYSIKFFDMDDNLVLEVDKITEPYLILDKVNFLHSGWFQYQLYENGIVLEKYKFFIPKDGKSASGYQEQGKRNN